MAEENKKDKGQNQVFDGFKYGFGFWLAGLALWLLVLAVVAALYYLL